MTVKYVCDTRITSPHSLIAYTFLYCNRLLCRLAGLYALGKEELLLELAMEFKTWVEVSFERMETLRALELPDVFTTEPGAGRIRVVAQTDICSASLHQWNKEHPTLAILPTSRPLVSFHPNVHVVPYSDHSSYQELEDFVSALKPTSVIPIVGKCVPGSLSALLHNKRRHGILVPESVQQYMLRQPENQLSSSSCSSVRRRSARALAPRGVVFESPPKISKKPRRPEAPEQEASDVEMDRGNTEKDSDLILVDLSQDEAPDTDRGAAGDDIVQILTDDVEAAEAQPPLSPDDQDDLTQVEIPASEELCARPVCSAGRLFEPNTNTSNKTTPSEEMGRCSPPVENSQYVYEADVISLHSDDEDEGEECDLQLLHLSLDSKSSSSPPATNQRRYLSIEEIEDSLLKDLPFTEEDFTTCSIMPLSLLRQFPLCPLYIGKKDKPGDSIVA